MKCIVMILAVLVSAQLCFGSGNGSVTVHLNGGSDILLANEWNYLEFWIANDEELDILTFGLSIHWHPSITITWDMSYGTQQPFEEHGRAIPAFDWVQRNLDFDNVSPDSMSLTGVNIGAGVLAPGPSELCYSARFFVAAPPGVIIDAFCIHPHPYNGPQWLFEESPTTGSLDYQPDFGIWPVFSASNPDAPSACFDMKTFFGGDADCSGGVDIDDVVYMIVYIFSGGPPPCDPDGDGMPDC